MFVHTLQHFWSESVFFGIPYNTFGPKVHFLHTLHHFSPKNVFSACLTARQCQSLVNLLRGMLLNVFLEMVKQDRPRGLRNTENTGKHKKMSNKTGPWGLKNTEEQGKKHRKNVKQDRPMDLKNKEKLRKTLKTCQTRQTRTPGPNRGEVAQSVLFENLTATPAQPSCLTTPDFPRRRL